MIQGPARFELYLTQLEAHLTTASRQANPAIWMFENNTRTPLFMLESLAKLYGNLHDKPMFAKMKERFKELEDVLGDIDYYDYYAKEFLKNKEIPAAVIAYLQNKKTENVNLLNTLLIDKKWLGENANRVDKMKKKLKSAAWMKENAELDAIKVFYQHAIVELKVFFGSAEHGFTDMENQVHALRRKLRWLSIYPQALRGCIQLIESHPPEEKLNKYLTPDIINSPFNKLPDAGNNKYFLLMERQYFLALSWMIAELGKLKDTGLAYFALEEALASQKPAHTDIHASIALPAGDSIESILAKATTICKDYFHEQLLEKMVLDVNRIKK